MIGRKSCRNFFNSRCERRAQKAMLRAKRSDKRWLGIFFRRENRFARWNKQFKPFIPLTIARFKYFWSVIATALSGLVPTISTRPRSRVALNRSGMISLGGGRKIKSKQRTRKSAARANGYEALEARQLLAFNITGIAGDFIVDSTEVSSFTVTASEAAAGEDVTLTISNGDMFSLRRDGIEFSANSNSGSIETQFSGSEPVKARISIPSW